MSRWLVCIFTTFLIAFNLNALEYDVNAKTDTNNVLIGDQLHYIITVHSKVRSKIIFPSLKDSIGSIEILRTFKTDTVGNDSNLILRKRYLITGFDTGKFFVPSLPVVSVMSNGRVDTLFTNPVAIHFTGLKVDTTKPIKDIKPVMEEPLGFWDYFPYILVFFAVIALVYLGVWLWKKYKRKDEPEPSYDPSIPPHVLAKEALRLLEHEKLWQKGQIKLYHSRLSDILRTYLERRFGFLAMEMTTNEIFDELKSRNFDAELTNILKQVLDLADLVKFAKYHPLPDENASSMTLAVDFVDKAAALYPLSEQVKEGKDVQ